MMRFPVGILGWQPMYFRLREDATTSPVGGFVPGEGGRGCSVPAQRAGSAAALCPRTRQRLAAGVKPKGAALLGGPARPGLAVKGVRLQGTLLYWALDGALSVALRAPLYSGWRA